MTPTQVLRRQRLNRIGAAALLLAMASAAPALARNPLKLPDTQYEPIAWAMIDGWAVDDHNAALGAFRKSCKAILQGDDSRGGMIGGLFKACQKAVAAAFDKPGEARAFFEQNFRPVRISPLSSPEGDGFITGYYEPIVDGTREKGDGYEHPLYRRPTGVGASVDSGKKKKKRRKLAFHDRAAIDDGALAGRDLEICWLKDPIDSFFIHIQGSVRVLLDDGKLMRLNYSAANGHPYYAVGRWLIDKGIIDKDEMSMDRIREWMERNPAEARTLRRMNKSYVFFRETHLPANEEPIGAQGISLTPGRSIAVDRKLHIYGTPFFISAHLPIQGLKPDTWFKRLMIAQDTGGAIVGPARADLYFGAGDEAASVSGRLRHYGKFVMLVPKTLMPTTVDDEIPLPRVRPPDLTSDGIAADSPEAAAAARELHAKQEKSAKADKADKKTKSAKVTEKTADKKSGDDKKPAKQADKQAEKKADKKSDKAAKVAEKKSSKPAEDKKTPSKGKKSDASTSKSNPQAQSRHDPQS
jgi:membrane-bound lytic murein transglycosylase A